MNTKKLELNCIHVFASILLHFNLYDPPIWHMKFEMKIGAKDESRLHDTFKAEYLEYLCNR